MEVPELACPVSPARDPPAPAPRPPGAAGGQAPPHLALGPAILPPEQGRAPAVFLKALPIPLYHTVPPGGLQPRAPLVAGSLDGGGVPFLLSPLLQPEGPGPAHAGKPATPTLTVSIVGALPVLSPGPGPALGGLGKARHAGKYLCPHCGRDCLKPSVLEKHIRSHTGERPFPCATCGIAFKTQSNLYKHRRTQTHLNNSRLSSESDGAGGSLLEEGGRAGGAPRAAGPGGSWSPGRGDGAPSERPLSPGVQGTAHLSPVAKNVDLKLEAVCCPGSAAADGEARTASTGLSTAAGPQPRRPLPGQRSPPASRACSLPQQQAPPSEKPWDTKASEGRLRKCESTDSGYLSRSDSAEQPLAPSSPLHSLSEHSAESEGEAAPGPGGARAAPGGRGPSLELEKRQLEERIARLISHNQAVVDDPQLDHVRPRKTVLSKQGSIDLPMPYTYKDSFHFEIRAPEPGRRRPGAPRAARSTCTPLDKARPLFFHSVPTQLSATVECVPVTRSNSLPVVEGTRTWQEPPEPQDACPRRQKPLSPRPAAARLADVPSGHPRALVRQAAVEDLPCPPTRDTMTPREDPDGKKAVAGDEGAAGRGRAAGRRCSQRRLQMFSQERWRVYGRETFQRLYQKMRASRQGSRKAREVGAGCGAEQGLPPQEEAAGGEGAARTHDRRTPVCGDASVGAQPGPVGSPPATEGSLVTESPKQRQTVATSAGEEQPRGSGAASPPRHCGEPPCLDGKSPVPPPRGSLEPGCPLPPAPGPLKGGDQEAPRLVLPDPEQEGGAQGGGDAKEPCQQALVLPVRPCGSSGEPQPVEPPLPSERKKLRVEGPSGVELPGPLGAGGQAPAPPGQAASSPSWNQDGGPGDKPAGPHRSAECTARGRAGPPEASGAHFSASSVAPRPVGLRDKEPGLGPAAAVPGGRSPPLPQTQASDVPAAPTHTTFPPKYLLRLPQGETSPPQPGARGPLGGSGWPEDPASSAGSEPATLLPSLPDAGLAPGRADGCREGPSWSRLWGRGKRAPEEGRGDMDPNTPQAGASPGIAAVLPAWACGPQRTETRDAGHLRSGSTGASAQPPGAALNPWPLDKDVAEPPENVPEGPPSGPPAEHSPRCSLRPSSILSSAQLPAGWPGLAAGARSDSPGSGGPQGPFPSLRAEPRLTWCCLGRSLPLPAEQEKAASACWVPHRPGGCPPGQGADARPASKAASGRWTRTSPAEGGATRPWKLSYLTAPGGTSGDAGPEPAWKKGPPRRRAKPSRGSSKQKALRRYRGSFLQGRVQLRARRLCKPLWALRKDSHPPHGEGLDPRRTLGQAASEMAGAPKSASLLSELSLQGEPPCASAALSLGCGKGEEEEEDRRPTSGGASPSASSRGRVQDVTPSAGEHSDCSPQNTAVGSGLSLPPDSCVQVAGNSLLSRGRGLDVGFPETPRVPSQEQVSADAKPDIVSDAQEPASLEPKGNALCCDTAASGAAICPSLGARGGHTTLGAPGTEAQEPGRAAGDALTRGSPDSEATVQGTSLSLSPGRPSPGQRLSSSVPSRPPGKTHLEIPASGPGSTSSHQDAARPKALLPSGGRPGCGEMPVSCPPMGKDREKCHESGFRAPQDGVVPSKSGQPTEVSQAPSKTIKKRSLEGMRKQSRVELSDTSSDDEDRLVIEI